ncbi:hypothetical protein SELMODRAFT_445401 [Selaginella moellendorffii]|uniref:CID domain-containing protein n=1 Tax=Selaginella moellendorffii TaxID=88036 RepID=D8SIA3_SELML|nr:UPF0400 protein C337.03 [Selaginella moellendorffii]EFJ15833.1 hypothetical protein SELMODRAFT_445401 [Selaginella moellendorffii]|eukprot:XP_002983024.1 UPF0400 protein C337.03 [Selaginella moellendorffii]
MQGLFSGQNLSDKLVKLNSTQQSIETLSHWCIFHRKYAKQVVDIWEKEFFQAPREQRVPFLFLANDILQNSRRKGSEFVSEFWRALPGALKLVMQNGDDSNRNTILRLIDIWEERRVFGSHAHGLRVELLGKDDAKNSDALMPEKLVAVYKAFQDKLTDEDATVYKCQTAVLHMDAFEKEIDTTTISGQESSIILIEELQQRETILLECAQQLEAIEIARSSIVFQLKETLRDQEDKLERTRLLLQAAHTHADQARMMQQQIYDAASGQAYQPVVANGSTGGGGLLAHHHHYDSSNQQHSVPSLLSSEAECYVPTEAKMFDPAAAAEVAAKLVASSSSAAMISSVLSSLAAENVVKLQDPQDKHLQQQQRSFDDPTENYGQNPEEVAIEEEVEEEEDPGREPPEKRQKVDEGEEESESLLGPAVELEEEFGEEVSAAEVTSSIPLSPAAVVAAVAAPPATEAVTTATAVATTIMGSSSSMLLPFSFGGQSLGFPLPVAAPPGCAPASDHTSTSLFALPRQ